MLTAIALIALVAVAMAAAASVFRLDLRRTAASMDDAQLRQLLVSGERIARARLAVAPAGAADEAVVLPATLRSQGASLRVRVQPADPDRADATVEAALAGRALSQTLRYERGPDGWRAVAAELQRGAAPGR